jgi:5'-nucleotidase
MKTIAITNDDGYTEGVNILMGFASGIGKTYVIVPERQRSAVSAAITLHKPLRMHKADRTREIYTLSGTPADCAVFSIYAKEFPTPDILFSGINWGDNTGLSPLISSGTIGAVWKAAIHGIPSVAFSIFQKQHSVDRFGWMDRKNWQNPEGMKKALKRIWRKIEPEMKTGRFFVVNLPSPFKLDRSKIVFPKRIQMKRTSPIIERRKDVYGNPYFWLGGKDPEIEKGTDFYEVAVKGNIAITRVELDRLANP